MKEVDNILRIFREAREAVEDARKVIAKSIGAKSKEIIFTSGGTESNNLVLKGLFFSNINKKNMKLILCPHGNSDKGHIKKCKMQAYANQDMVFLYADHMMTFKN